MNLTAITALGTEVAKVLNNVLDKLPSRDQKKLEEFYKFLDTYYLEVNRADSDTDDIVTWKQRKKLLTDTIILEIWYNKKTKSL